MFGNVVGSVTENDQFSQLVSFGLKKKLKYIYIYQNITQGLFFCFFFKPYVICNKLYDKLKDVITSTKVTCAVF